jgi:hypothetical protein
MSTDTRDAGQIAEDALAALYESSTDEAMAIAAEALARAIRACPDEGALEQLLDRPHVVDLFGNGIGSLPLWPPVVDAMVSLAEGLSSATDAARVLGWARWSCGAPPTLLVRPDIAPSLVPVHREACLPAFEARAPLYRRWLGDASPERRAAGAHALAWCRSATLADVSLVLAGATAEPDGTALGSALVTLGVLVRRLDANADAARAVAHDKLAHAEPFARACAAVALALMGETLSAEATSALTEVVLHPVPLPAGWGWRTAAKIAYESNALACAVLNWAPTLAADDAARALARVELPYNAAGEAMLAGVRERIGEEAWRDFARAKPQHAGPCEGLIMGALAHLAFETQGRALPPHGLVASELDATQRLALEAIGRRTPQAPDALQRVGLHASRADADLVTDFLAGTRPEWRPMTIEVDGQQRRWHFGPLWGATVFGRVSVPAAADAILAAMTPAEAVELVTRFSKARMTAYGQIKDYMPFQRASLTADEQAKARAVWERDQELALAVIDSAVARGFDLDEMMRAVAVNTLDWLPAIAAVAYLRAHPDSVPAEFQRIIDDGLSQTRVDEPLVSLVARLRAGGKTP